MTDSCVDRRRGGVLARVRLPRRASRPAARGAAARPSAPRRAGGLGGAGQRARRRLPDRLAGRVAARRAHRLSSLLGRAPALCRPDTGRPGQVHRGRRRRPARSHSGADTALVPTGRMPGACSRSWRPGCAPWCRTVAAGAWPRWVCRRPAPPMPCRSRWPIGSSATRPARRARAHRRRGPAARPGRVPRRRRGGRARRPPRRQGGAGGPGAAPGERAGARSGAGAARMPHLPVGRGRPPRARGLREQRERRAHRARRRTGRPGRRACMRDRGRRRSRTICWRVPPRRSTGRSAGGASCRARSASRTVRARCAGGLAEAVFRGHAGEQPRRDPAAGGGPGARPAVGAAGERRARLAGRGDRRGAGATDEDPVVLLPDHATLGGYPVLAVVASADHGRLGQCAPGTRVRLVPVDLAAAHGRGPDVASHLGAGAWSGTTRWRSSDAPGVTADQTSSFTAVPTPMTTTTARSAGAGRVRASRAPT